MKRNHTNTAASPSLPWVCARSSTSVPRLNLQAIGGFPHFEPEVSLSLQTTQGGNKSTSLGYGYTRSVHGKRRGGKAQLWCSPVHQRHLCFILHVSNLVQDPLGSASAVAHLRSPSAYHTDANSRIADSPIAGEVYACWCPGP